jgi:hypothetical protein
MGQLSSRAPVFGEQEDPKKAKDAFIPQARGWPFESPRFFMQNF